MVEHVVIGALARLDPDLRDAAVARLGQLEGVSPFEIAERGRVGLLVEGPSLDAAHDRLAGELKEVPGVLCVWPISVHLEDEEEQEEGNQ